MFKKSVIIIPNISNEDQVCDFLFQTKKILEKNNFVYIVDCSATQSVLSIFKKIIFGKPINLLLPIDLLPLRRFRLVKDLNQKIYFFLLQLFLLIKHNQATNNYLWLFFPQLASTVQFKLFNWKLIFDIVDFHTSDDKKINDDLDTKRVFLLKKSDYVFTISNCLYDQYSKFIKKKNIKLKKKIKIVPQGFDLESFSNNCKESKLVFSHEQPIIGFVGQISERLDFDLLKSLIKGNKKYNFVFIGPFHHESNVPQNNAYEKIFFSLLKEKNCFYYEKQSRESMLSILNNFDICMIPYDSSFEFNRYSYPMKIFEYFYAGKPVVSTKIEELERFPDFVKMGESAKEWQSNIKFFLSKKWSNSKIAQVKEISLQNSWTKKLGAIYEYIKQTS